MKHDSRDPEVERLLALCLELYEGHGPRAVDEVLARHPDRSQHVRARLDLLGRMGLVGEPPPGMLPEAIGPYRIVGVLGRGGMGVVYEARQEAPRRHVALKVMRSWPGAELRSRFRHETELLARLQHPGIAQLLDAGTATVGGTTVPYFAMELVRGEPIDRHARTRGLDRRARVELLARVGDAVHHAHQKGVVHRDLKPGNVLVDEHGQPRVLDFGIARLADPDLALSGARTRVGELVGTLATMSPEQAAGDPARVDSRADVYALGVIAYELLAGRLPHPVEGRPLVEVLRTIREQDPPSLGSLDRGLRGDLDTIVAKALAKDRERRYATAHELAEDLRRHLRHEPIAARPATATYQLARFARRHRGWVAGAAAVLLALALGLAGTLTGMLRAARERDDAEGRFRQASAVIGFQRRMFAEADPTRKGVRVDELLDRAVGMVDGEARSPLEEAALRLVLGEAYEGLGKYARAEPLLVRAQELFEAELGPDDLQTLGARTRLAGLYAGPLVRLDEGEAVLEGVVETAERVHGRAHGVTLGALVVRSKLEHEHGRYAQAVRVAEDLVARMPAGHELEIAGRKRLAASLDKLGEHERAIEEARAVCVLAEERLGEAHPTTWEALATCGSMLFHSGHAIEGSQVFERLVQLRTRHVGATHPETLNARGNLAMVLLTTGEYERAEEVQLEVLAGFEALYGPDHPERLWALNSVGMLYLLWGRYREAEPYLREAFERTSDLRGPEHLDTVTSMANLASTLERLGQGEEAEELFRIALEIRRRTLGDRHVETLVTSVNLAGFLARTGRHEEADLLLGEAVQAARDTLGEESSYLGEFLAGYGGNLVHMGRFEEAERALIEGLERCEGLTLMGSSACRVNLKHLAMLYRRWGRPEQAARYQARFDGGP